MIDTEQLELENALLPYFDADAMAEAEVTIHWREQEDRLALEDNRQSKEEWS